MVICQKYVNNGHTIIMEDHLGGFETCTDEFPNGDMNTYDYQKMLRKDNRWQYTQQANQEVAYATQKVLQDFGFMG